MKGRREDPETTGGVSVRRNILKRRSTSLTDMSEHPEIRRRHNTFLIKQVAPPTWFRRMALSKCCLNTGTGSFKAGPVFDEDVDSGFSELQVLDADCKRSTTGDAQTWSQCLHCRSTAVHPEGAPQSQEGKKLLQKDAASTITLSASSVTRCVT